jgi:hypothetical protein
MILAFHILQNQKNYRGPFAKGLGMEQSDEKKNELL